MQRGYGTGSLEAVRQTDGTTLYLARWRDASGSRRQRFVGSERRTAERSLATIIADRDAELMGLKPQASVDVRFDDLSAKYLADLATRTKPSQVRSVTRYLRDLSAYFRNPRLLDVRKERVLDYRRYLAAEGNSNATINLKVGALRALCRFGVRMDLLPRNPVEGLPPLPGGKAHERRPRRALTESELARVLDAAEAIDEERRARCAAEATIEKGTKGPGYAARRRTLHVPQTPLIRALAYTGARYGEMVQTTWSDWDRRTRKLTFRAETTKSKKARRVPLLDAVEADLSMLCALHAEGYGRAPLPSERIFLSPGGYGLESARENVLRFFYEALARAGVVRNDPVQGAATIHSLRHTFASMLARANAGLTQAQALLGHSTPELTAARYTHHDEADLRAAVQKIGVPASKRAVGDG
ncbi:MAG TPA: tyrosine-type recombinase/integrase [Planctomycetota bacterium]|nr:tyrosine-type recombinase/integrase [Planctomycetota bacterium]